LVFTEAANEVKAHHVNRQSQPLWLNVMKNEVKNHFRGFCGCPSIALMAFWAMGLLEMLALPIPAADDSETWGKIRNENLESLVFITVKGQLKNGLTDTFYGSGFIVDPAGYVLTCNHVVPVKLDYVTIQVTGSVGGRFTYAYPLTPGRRDLDGDVMLLKLPHGKWRSVKSGADAQRDSNVDALGFPLMQDVVEAPGSITGENADGRWITNAGLLPGMSGGPAFDRLGNVVGIVAAGYEEAKSRLDLLIPIRQATDLLQSIHSPLLPIKAPADNHDPVTLLLNSSDPAYFKTLFDKEFVPVTWSNVDSVLRLDRGLLARVWPGLWENHPSRLSHDDRETYYYVENAMPLITSQIGALLEMERPPGFPLNLSSTYFTSGDWSDTNFGEANLEGIWVQYMDLGNAELKGIKRFKGVRLQNTAWWEVKSISKELFDYLKESFPFKPNERYGPNQKIVSQQEYDAAVRRLTVYVIVNSSDADYFNTVFSNTFAPVTWSNVERVLALDRALAARAKPVWDKEWDLEKKHGDSERLTEDEVATDDYVSQTTSLITSQIGILLRTQRPPGAQIDLSNALFHNGNWKGVNFDGANINYAWLNWMDLQNAELKGVEQFVGADFSGTAWWEVKSINKELFDYLREKFPFDPNAKYGYGPNYEKLSQSQQEYDRALRRLTLQLRR
jgi:uncharacterized protein YjbI with pentapeptide repeats/S1-C subfamily serine protease